MESLQRPWTLQVAGQPVRFITPSYRLYPLYYY